MSNFKRMHLVAIPSAIVCMIWLFPKWSGAISQNWQRGIGFTLGMLMAGYILGCIFGLVLNLVLKLFRK
jgi:ABC-type methionine transport system permease subunit